MEQAIADSADCYAVRFLKGGRQRELLFRSFTEAHSAAAMSPDPKALIECRGEQPGQKVTVQRNDWPRWLAHFA